MSAESATAAGQSVSERLIVSAIRLLAEEGPSAIKARTVASATGLSTMAVYSNFGGVPELTRAVIDRGFTELGDAFAGLETTDDPVADLAAAALTCRAVARANPHLYDLMFGLSTRATYRPVSSSDVRTGVGTEAFRRTYGHVIEVCRRVVSAGRFSENDENTVAAQLWSFVHGFITLELAQAFAVIADPVGEVFLPLGVNISIGLGDTRERAEASHRQAARRVGSMHRSAGSELL